MYKKYIFISLLLICCIPISLFSSTNRIGSNKVTFAPATSTKIVGQIPSGTIYIINDTAFSQQYNLPGSGTKDDPYRIENFNITPDQFYGIGIASVTKYVVIKNCTIDADQGISIDWVAPGRVQIISNYITHARNGITIYDSDGVLIANNTLVDTYQNSFNVASSNGVNIVGNRFINSNGSRVIAQSRDIVFLNNTIVNTSTGLSIQNSDNVSVLNSEISSNSIGVELKNSSNNNVIGNNISFNSKYAVSLDSYSQNNNIYFNQFNSNNKNSGTTSSQALDNGKGNFWYNKEYKIGNYWSNWNTGDYSIDGSAQNKDIYPLSLSQYSSIDPHTLAIFSSSIFSNNDSSITTSLDISFIEVLIGGLVLVPVTLVKRKRI